MFETSRYSGSGTNQNNVQTKDNGGCCFHCNGCCKCLMRIAKIPYCLTRFIIGFILLGILISIVLGLYYGMNIFDMYDKAKHFLMPYIKNDTKIDD